MTGGQGRKLRAAAEIPKAVPASGSTTGRAVEYVLPLRWGPAEDMAELTEYLAGIAAVADITVVDGSTDLVFAAHHRAWSASVRHIRPDPWPGHNGKVAGVVTGVFRARHQRVIIADDDVRYTPQQIRAIAALLDEADLVRPQNIFDPLPWHARWDTARTLINRAFGADYPGTFALRSEVFRRMGGYDGDVLFENLQMIRTFRAAGARELRAGDLYVRRLPPTVGRFLHQRVRQAYDDFAQPARLIWELSWLPSAIAAAATRPRGLGYVAVTACLIAELGRRRHGGAEHFRIGSSLWAPAWVAERAVCVWIAVANRAVGGVRYAGSRITRATRPVAVAIQEPATTRNASSSGSDASGIVMPAALPART